MRKLPPWAVAWLVCGLSALSASLIHEPAHRLEYTRVVNRRGEPLRVAVYFPANVEGRAPGVVLCQPLNDPPEYARMLALELVRNGFVVLSFDWRGRARDENRQLLREHTQETLRADVRAAVAYLRGLEQVDPARLVLAGHSVGGTLAIDAAENDLDIRAVAVIGMEADVLPAIPRNVLWAVGLYDEFRPLGHMRQVFHRSAATQENEGVTTGDFARGTARRLAVSPTANHLNELKDWGVERSVVNWFCEVLGMKPDTSIYQMELRGLIVMLAWFAALAGALLTVRRFWAGRRVVLHVAAGATLAGIWFLGRFRGDAFLAAADGILMLFLFALLAGFLAQRESGPFGRATGNLAHLVGIVWLSVLVTLALNNIPYYFQQAYYALMLPEFAVKYLLDLADAYLLDYARPLFFQAYGPDVVAPHLWVYALAAVEIVRPGVLLSLAARVARWKPRPAEPAARPRPVVAMVLLAILVLFFCGVLWLRLKQGFLTEESARTGLQFLLRFAVPPFFLSAFLWRWMQRRRELNT